jgi:hypothetical protein
MRSVLILALLALTGCGAQVEATFETIAERTPRPSQTARPTPAVAASPTASPTAEPAPTPFGAAVFTDPDDCTNPGGGYRVAYPRAWYSNAAGPNPFNPAGECVPACMRFAPTEFVVVYGSEISPDVAIWIRVDELPEGIDWDYGPFPGHSILSDSATAVDGQPARVREIEVTERDIAFSPGDRYTEYVIQVSDSRFLLAQTYSQPDYATSKVILDQMMETLRFTSP